MSADRWRPWQTQTFLYMVWANEERFKNQRRHSVQEGYDVQLTHSLIFPHARQVYRLLIPSVCLPSVCRQRIWFRPLYTSQFKMSTEEELHIYSLEHTCLYFLSHNQQLVDQRFPTTHNPEFFANGGPLFCCCIYQYYKILFIIRRYRRSKPRARITKSLVDWSWIFSRIFLWSGSSFEIVLYSSCSSTYVQSWVASILWICDDWISKAVCQTLASSSSCLVFSHGWISLITNHTILIVGIILRRFEKEARRKKESEEWCLAVSCHG